MNQDTINVRSLVLDKMPDGLSELEKMRYIHIELGKLLKYDMNYSAIDRYAVMSKIRRDKILDRDVSDLEHVSPYQVCKGLSEIYSQLLNEAGINSEVVETGKDPFKHYYTVIHTKEEGDLVQDFVHFDELFRIKMGFEPRGIMTKELLLAMGDRNSTDSERAHAKLMNEKLQSKFNDIDKKLGYANDEKYFEEEYLQSFSNLPFEEKLDFIFSQDIADVGLQDAYIGIRQMIKGVFGREGRKIKESFFAKEDYDSVDIKGVYSVDLNGETKRYLMEKDKPFREVSEEEIVEIIDSGLLPRKGYDIQAMPEFFRLMQNQIDSESLPDQMSYEWSQGEHDLESYEDLAVIKKESDLKDEKKDIKKAKEDEHKKDSNEETK